MTLYELWRQAVAAEEAVALATLVAGPIGIGAKLLIRSDGRAEGDHPSDELVRMVAKDAADLLHLEKSETRSFELPEGRYDVFIDVYPPPQQIIIVGATDTAAALCEFASRIGYRVLVTDARAAFAAPERFPDAYRVIKGWPQDVLPTLRLDASTYLVLLSHDPKFDEPTLMHAIPSHVRYIGAIGSRKTQTERFERLQRQGFTQHQLERVYGPVGLDIGGRTAAETALAIMAEITAVRHSRDGGFMRQKFARSAGT